MAAKDTAKIAVEDLSETQAKVELKRLAAEIGAHDRRYYQEDAPSISDAAYDALRRRNEAIELAKRGRGSLCGSLVTADPALARKVVLGVAPFHGRLMVLDRTSAKESTGHGSPLPNLVHGGPGRAGAAEAVLQA